MRSGSSRISGAGRSCVWFAIVVLAVGQVEPCAAQEPAAGLTKEAMEKSLRVKLERAVSIDFIETPLVDIVDFLAMREDLSLQIDRELLEKAMISADQRVTARLIDVRLATLLDVLLKPLGLQWHVDDAVVWIIPTGDLEHANRTSMFSIADLMPDSMKEREKLRARLNHEFSQVVAPTIWRENGGSGKYLFSERGVLVVDAPPGVVEQVERFLNASRRMQALKPEDLRAPVADPVRAAIENFSVHSPAGARMRQSLDKRTDLDLVETPLRDVLRLLAERAGCSIHLDGLSLERHSLDMDQPVTLRAKQWQIRSVLQRILASRSAAWTAVDNVLVVHGRGDADYIHLRLYPVADLLDAQDGARDFREPHQVFPFGWQPLDDELEEVCQPADGWAVDGGMGAASLFPELGMLALNHSEEAHERIEAALRQMRQAKASAAARPQPLMARSYVLARLPSGQPRVPFEEAVQLVKSRLPESALQRPGTTIRLIGDRIFVEHDRAVHGRVEEILGEELGVLESTSRPPPADSSRVGQASKASAGPPLRRE
ncbi:MAG: hypothetical protein U0939_27025 [Pirellulales bacterium]